ncbi:MAG: AAA family ATPase, partial [Bacteroidota bacterium]|nr:AAA family ATPase [Bacteroidota bacterium]
HGVGKSSLLKKAAQTWEKDHPVHFISLQDRCISSTELISRLASALNISATTTNEFIQSLQEMPSSVICIDDFHRCMLRDVGGYDAIRTLLSIMQGVAQHHFWVCTFHLHAWIFLHSASTPVQLNIFRKEVHVKPLDFLEVKNWITTRCQEANIQLDFSEISTMANKESLYRAEQAFWRLLTDLTKGNPSVIEKFWIDSMRKGEKEREVKIVLFSIPNEEILEQLSDTEAFVLSYLLIHNEMTLKTLQRSLNVSISSLRNASRNLLGLGLIETVENNYKVNDEWWPIVERFLVKKRMIYLE